MLLKDYLKEHNITQRTMASRLGITITYLRMLLFFQSAPSKKMALKIEETTNGEVSKYEALFFEDYIKE